MNQLIKLDHVHDNPYQPRTTDDQAHIESLARSIATEGLLQEPKARANGQGVQLAFGHSRRKAFEWLAANFQAQGLTDRYEGYTVIPLDIVELTDEQMYRHAVTENVQRKDLNPIELAQAMADYMEKFDKTSDEAGELFGGMSGATVRGKVRYLDLHENAREALAAGRITEGTARTLLSFQKIAPEQAVKKTVELIEKTEGETPDDVIERSLRSLDEVVEMWSDSRRNGKPRSTWNGGWLLDMKNFPNKLLPALTPVDAAIALGIEDDEAMMEKVSAWLEEPGSVELPETIQAKLEHLINPPACTACPFYTKVQGAHYCGVKVCHTRKSAAWAEERIRQASKSLKIEMYQESDGAYKILSYENQNLFKKRDKGLRLMTKAQAGDRIYQWGFEGVDGDIFCVVAVGDTRDKMKTATSRGGKKTDAELTRMRQLRIYRPRRRELIWEFTLAASSLFDSLGHSMLEQIDRWRYLEQDLQPSKDVVPPDNAKEEVKAEYLRRLLVWKFAADSWHEANNVTKFADIVERLDELAKEWGVKMPKSIRKMSEQFQAEVDAVAAETKKSKKNS